MFGWSLQVRIWLIFCSLDDPHNELLLDGKKSTIAYFEPIQEIPKESTRKDTKKEASKKRKAAADPPKGVRSITSFFSKK